MDGYYGILHGPHWKGENPGNTLRIWDTYLRMYLKEKYFREEKKLENKCLKIGMCLHVWKTARSPMMVEAESKGGYQKGKRDHSIKKVFDFYSALNSKTLQNFQLRR